MIRVFLVDDEFYERLSLKSAVPWEDLGMAVCGEANNGLTAYSQMLELKPDIAIVDINMPRMNGLDLISGLREKNLACRFIILTGYDDFKYAQQAVSLGVSEYVLKPIHYPDLISILKKTAKKIEEEQSLSSQLDHLDRENRQFALERSWNDLVSGALQLSDDPVGDGTADSLMIPFPSWQAAVLSPSPGTPMEKVYLLQQKILHEYDPSLLVVFPDAARQLCLLLNGAWPEASPDLPRKLFNFAVQGGCPCLLGVGNKYNTLAEIPRSYQEARTALQTCDSWGEAMLFYSDVADASEVTHSIEAYIGEHYADPRLSIKEISQALFLNYSYLCYCFKRDRRMTINDYLNSVRIQKAEEMFQNHIENVSIVAEKTGFSSASYFSKQFKKSTGQSPTDYIRVLGKLPGGR